MNFQPPIVLLAAENASSAAEALRSKSIGQIWYFAAVKEAQGLAAALREREISIGVTSVPAESLREILKVVLALLHQLDENLPEQTVEESYGVSLQELERHLKLLAQIGA